MSNKLIWGSGIGVLILVALMFGFFWGGNSTPQSTVYVNGVGVDYQSGMQSNALIVNGVELTDHTIYDPETNTCTASNLGMEIVVEDCFTTVFYPVDIQQYVDFTWTGENPQKTSWVFVYEGELENGNMKWFNENANHTEEIQVTNEQYVNNYLVDEIINYTNLGTPDPDVCELGTENNTMMFDVTRVNATHHKVYCFSEQNPINATAFLISGNASITSTEEIQVQGTWQNIPINYLGSDLLGNGFSYYEVTNKTFQPDETVNTWWTYTPEGNQEDGKWHILGYNGEGIDDLFDAITNEQYIYMDPSWYSNLDEGLVGWWKLNETSGTNAWESVRGIYNGTNNGAGLGMAGIIGDAYDFEATDTDYVDIADIDITNEITISAWVNHESLTNYQGYVEKGRDTSWGLDKEDTTDLARLRVKHSGGVYTVTSTSAVSTGRWIHVVGTFNLSEGLEKIYFNGTNEANTSVGDNIATDNNNIKIGKQFDGLGMDGLIDEVAIWNRSISAEEVTQLYNGGAGITYNPDGDTGDFNVELLTPLNQTITSSTEINFSAVQNASGLYDNENATLFVWNSTNDLIASNSTTLSGNGSAIINWSLAGFGEDIFHWDVFGCANNGTNSDCNWSLNGNYSFQVDFSPPVVTFTNPAQFANITTTSFPVNVSVDVLSSDATLDSCWLTTSENATVLPYPCNTTTSVLFNSEGSKYITAFANDSVGGTTSATRNLTIYFYNYTHFASSDVVAEGGQSTFTLNVSMTNIPGAQAFFTYNNTNFAPSTQTNTQNGSLFTYVLNVPVGYGNATGATQYYNWTFNITGFATDIVTDTKNQTVFTPSLSNCSAGGVQVLNFTHYDEETRQVVNFSNGNNLQVDLSLTSLYDPNIEFVYNATEINSPDLVVCLPDGVLNSTSYRLDLTGSYVGTDFVQEFFYIDNGTLSNSNLPQEYSWFDVLLDDSTTFLFSFLDENGLEVPGVIVETYRYYIGEGDFIEVERSKEDNNGETHIHLVEEDVIYKFRITLENQEIFLSDQYNAKCLSSPCSITLSAEPDVDPFPDVYNNLPEGSYAITTDKSTREVTLAFNLNETAVMNLTIWTQNNNEAEIVAQGTTSASTGSVTVTVPLQYANATYSAVIYHNNDFVTTRIVDLSESANDYFGALGLFLGALAVLCLALIGASHGEWVIVWTILGMVTASMLYLVDLPWYALMTFIAGAGVFLIKLVSRRRVG